MDPYYDTTFFTWCWTLIQRFQEGFRGGLYSDEIQLCALMLFGISSALLGVLLVLDKSTLVANSLSHTMLLGIVIAFVVTQVPTPPFLVMYGSAVLVALVTCYLIDWLSQVRYVSKDSSNAMVFSFFFAAGVGIISLYSKNARIGPELLMGDPDALSVEDLPGLLVSALLTGIAVPILLRGCVLAIFDPSFAAVSGCKPDRFKRLILFLVSLTSIVAFRTVGFVMTMAFFVLPPLIARKFVTSVTGMLGLSVVLSLLSAFLSVGFSRHLYTVYALPISTGAFSVVMLAGMFLFVYLCVTKRYNGTIQKISCIWS